MTATVMVAPVQSVEGPTFSPRRSQSQLRTGDKQPWLVITRRGVTGALIDHDRFADEDAAQAFADGERAKVTPCT